MDHLKSFEDHLSKCFDNIDRICEKLNEVHSKNMKKLQNSYLTSMEKLHNYKFILTDIIMSIKRTSEDFYPKLEEIRFSGKNLLEYEKKFFNFETSEFLELEEDIYEISDFKVFDAWKPIKVDQCDHSQRRILVTHCRKGHCTECISTNIDRDSYFCPCGTKLSPKDVYIIKDGEPDMKEVQQKLSSYKD
jgi:ribosomal protein S17E